MTTKKNRSTEGFTTLDAFLEEEGVRDEFQAVAINDFCCGRLDRRWRARNCLRRALPGNGRGQL